MTHERDYVLGTHDEELHRLGLRHRAWRARMLDAWAMAGITVGSRVVDLGCGPGYTTVDLAELVGAHGEVLAIERSARFASVAWDHGEFIDPPVSRDALMNVWEDGWNCVFRALAPLTDADLGRTITIRSEPHSVMQAINRQIAHYALHVGQIVFLAKHLRSTDWKSLSIPRNRSAEFNQRVSTGEAIQR